MSFGQKWKIPAQFGDCGLDNFLYPAVYRVHVEHFLSALAPFSTLHKYSLIQG